MLLPGATGDIVEKTAEVSRQILLVSHLIMPVIAVIGLAFGFGLLHNHSEIVPIISTEQGKMLLIVQCLLTAALLTIAQLTIWPRFIEAPTVSSSWVKSGSGYRSEQIEIITTSNKIATWQKVDTPVVPEDLSSIPIIQLVQVYMRDPNNKLKELQLWQALHQAIWHIPLFFWLAMTVCTIKRGRNATDIAGTAAAMVIAIGLLAEALSLLLSKLLLPATVVGLLPITLTIAFLTYRHIYKKHS